jgi:cell division septal protein FtsQ
MEIRDQKEAPKKEKKKKNGNKVLLIIIALLLIGNGVLIWQLIETKSEVKTIIVQKDQAQDHNSELQAELDSLMLEHEGIKSEYT